MRYCENSPTCVSCPARDLSPDLRRAIPGVIDVLFRDDGGEMISQDGMIKISQNSLEQAGVTEYSNRDVFVISMAAREVATYGMCKFSLRG